MTIQQIAEQVEGAVRLGDALGKSEEQIHTDVHAIAGHLSEPELEAVRQHIADSACRDRL